MSRFHRRNTIALLLAATAACVGTGRQGARPAATPVGFQVAAPISDADVEFMTGMIHHHAQAVAMARWAPTHGAGEAVRLLSERIVVGQRDEIELMSNWLRDRGQPVPEPTPGPARMKMGGMEHDMLMPGMLTAEQMTQLDRARGAEFDRLFLTFMIQHHEGAITMVDKLFGSVGAAQDEVVFRFASDVYADQTTEIDRMEKMLAAMPDSSRRP